MEGNPFDHDPDLQEEFSHVISNEDVTEADNDFSSDVYDDTHLRIELALPKRGELDPQFACITNHLQNYNGLPIGKASDKPIVDMRMYKV